jgi:vacuolar protein-sorting-associated protein 4
MIEERVTQYMDRMEQLKAHNDGAAGGGSGGATLAKGEGGGAGADAETDKLKGALAGAIVMEKPNVKWDDVAGLEAAKVGVSVDARK